MGADGISGTILDSQPVIPAHARIHSNFEFTTRHSRERGNPEKLNTCMGGLLVDAHFHGHDGFSLWLMGMGDGDRYFTSIQDSL